MSTELESILAKIELAKNARSRAEGSRDSIVDSWKAEYGFSTIEEAEEHLQILIDRKSKLEAKIESNMEILRELVDQ